MLCEWNDAILEWNNFFIEKKLNTFLMKWNAFKNEMKCSVNETFFKKTKKQLHLWT